MNLVQCEEEGEAAARTPGGSALDCPYTFAKAGVDQATFDREWRPRLNAWFAGWIRAAPPARKKPRQGGARKSS